MPAPTPMKLRRGRRPPPQGGGGPLREEGRGPGGRVGAGGGVRGAGGGALGRARAAPPPGPPPTNPASNSRRRLRILPPTPLRRVGTRTERQEDIEGRRERRSFARGASPSPSPRADVGRRQTLVSAPLSGRSDRGDATGRALR